MVVFAWIFLNTAEMEKEEKKQNTTGETAQWLSGTNLLSSRNHEDMFQRVLVFADEMEREKQIKTGMERQKTRCFFIQGGCILLELKKFCVRKKLHEERRSFSGW